MKRRLLLAVLLVTLLLSFSAAFAQGSQTLTVFAASSLTDAFTEIETAFESANAGVDVVFNLGSSSTLATMTPAGRGGGAVTASTLWRGVMSTPSSDKAISSSGFFLAFMMLGRLA